MKKITFFYIAFTIILLINIMLCNISYARIDTQNVNISMNTRSDLQDIGNKILGTVRVVVIFIAVGGAMVLGIRYMTESIDEQAKAKDVLVLYLIGAFLAFGVISIIPVVYKVLESVFN